MTTTTGGCLCGAVRYEADAQPDHASYCHCSLCRRATGAPVAAFARLPSSGFRVTKGEIKHYRSSAFAVRGFCAACGSPLTFQYDAYPAYVAVAIGSLDRPDGAAPERHWNFESRIAWFDTADALPRHGNVPASAKPPAT
jgi:hypothetical protein